jgi:hypothetical protein
MEIVDHVGVDHLGEPEHSGFTVELSITWVNRAADTRRSPLAAAVVATHSAARLEAVYISGGAPLAPLLR